MPMQTGCVSLLPSPWRYCIASLCLLSPSIDLANVSKNTFENLPMYCLFIDHKGAAICLTMAWCQLLLFYAADIITLDNSLPMLCQINPNNNVEDARFLWFLSHGLHWGKIQFAPFTTQHSCSNIRTAPLDPFLMLLANQGLCQYMIGGTRKWLTSSQPIMESLILPNLEPDKLPKLWSRIFNNMIPSKHQVLIWQCHHNAVYMGNVLHHFIPDHSSQCQLCEDE